MPQSNDREIFGRLNALESQLAEMRGSVASMSKAVSRAIWFLGFIAILELLVIAYGAIGERGMKSVRDTMPSRITDYITPNDGGLSRFQCRKV